MTAKCCKKTTLVNIYHCGKNTTHGGGGIKSVGVEGEGLFIGSTPLNFLVCLG